MSVFQCESQEDLNPLCAASILYTLLIGNIGKERRRRKQTDNGRWRKAPPCHNVYCRHIYSNVYLVCRRDDKTRGVIPPTAWGEIQSFGPLSQIISTFKISGEKKKGIISFPVCVRTGCEKLERDDL